MKYLMFIATTLPLLCFCNTNYAGQRASIVSKQLKSIDEYGNTELMGAIQDFDVIKAEQLLDTYIAKSRGNPSPKCSFITFIQDKYDQIILGDLVQALAYQTVSISSTNLLHNLLTFGEKYFKLRQWSLFLDKSGELCVIVPAHVASIKQLNKEYGFKGLRYIKPNDIASLKITGTGIPTEQLINNFKNIIDTSATQHPTRFYLSGHGDEFMIANMPITSIEKFFSVLADINTEFIYIHTCMAGGQNLIEMQNIIQKIVQKKLKSIMQKQGFLKKSSATKVATREKETSSTINYIIVIRATSDTVTMGIDNLRELFLKLDDYFKPAAPGKLSIEKIMKPLSADPFSLASIRFPGATTFFRAVDLGNMEILTWSRVRALRMEKPLKLVRLKQLKKAADNPKQREKIETQISRLELDIALEKADIVPGKEKYLINFPIKSNIKFVQIYPCDLTDFNFDMESNSVPMFISKIPGTAQHFIGKIYYKSRYNGFSKALQSFIEDGFTQVFEEKNYENQEEFMEDLAEGEIGGLTKKCWFIKSLELLAGNKTYSLDHLVVNINPAAPYNPTPTGIDQDAVSFFYHDKSGYHYCPGERGFHFAIGTIIDKNQFKILIQNIFEKSKPSSEALYEATAGNETFEMVQDAITSSWSAYLGMPPSNLMRAVLDNNESSVKELLKAHADPNVQIEGVTALMAAKNIAIVQQLLTAGADVNLKDKEGRTALIRAVLNNNGPLVEKLLKAHADPDIQDNQGETALTWAKLFGHDRIVSLLLEAGANPMSEEQSKPVQKHDKSDIGESI